MPLQMGIKCTNMKYGISGLIIITNYFLVVAYTDIDIVTYFAHCVIHTIIYSSWSERKEMMRCFGTRYVKKYMCFNLWLHFTCPHIHALSDWRHFLHWRANDNDAINFVVDVGWWTVKHVGFFISHQKKDCHFKTSDLYFQSFFHSRKLDIGLR